MTKEENAEYLKGSHQVLIEHAETDCQLAQFR
jgi:hypothetical protein